jgi:hypothetical protein
MSHRKTDLGIPRRSKSAKVVLGCGLIKPEPEPDASDFDHSEIVECAAVISGGDVTELLELVEAALDEIALLVFGFAIGDAVVPV